MPDLEISSLRELLKRRPVDYRAQFSITTIHGDSCPAECQVFLPIRQEDRIWILIRIKGCSSYGATMMLGWKFSAELSNTDSALTITAGEVYHSGWIDWKWDDSSENTLIGEAAEITINQGPFDQLARSSCFYFTENVLLSSLALSLERSSTGAIEPKVIRPGPQCDIGGALVTFENEYELEFPKEPAGLIRKTYLANVVVEPGKDVGRDSLVAKIDALLVLASFAQRHRTVCTGWKIQYSNGSVETHYRRNITLPNRKRIDVDDTLISLGDIEIFLNSTFTKFVQSEAFSALERAMFMALHGQEPGISDSFVMMFTGVETLLTHFRENRNLAAIIQPKSNWKLVREAVRQFLKTCIGVQQLGPDKQAQLFNKLEELNRPSFADTFTEMCTQLQVDLSDLWPMKGNASLSAIRNRIVHGHKLTQEQEFAITSAKLHLQWSLERLILHYLCWPINESRVSLKSLSGRTAYMEWRKDMETLKN